jgi:SLT domain-containing protein
MQQAQLGMGLVLDQLGLVVAGPAVIGGQIDHIAFAQGLAVTTLGVKAAHARASFNWEGKGGRARGEAERMTAGP